MSKVSKKVGLKPKTVTDNKKMYELQNIRILQKNLIYVIGLSSENANIKVNYYNQE